MGSPEKACRECSWYIRGHSYDGPVGFGGCFRRKQWACANQTACVDDFERGRPCLSIQEAEIKWQVRELRAFVEHVADWRNGESWDDIEKAAGQLLEGLNDER
jgi:hypothetical protein